MAGGRDCLGVAEVEVAEKGGRFPVRHLRYVKCHTPLHVDETRPRIHLQPQEKHPVHHLLKTQGYSEH